MTMAREKGLSAKQIKDAADRAETTAQKQQIGIPFEKGNPATQLDGQKVLATNSASSFSMIFLFHGRPAVLKSSSA